MFPIDAATALKLIKASGLSLLSDILDAMSRQQTYVVTHSRNPEEDFKDLRDAGFVVSKHDHEPNHHQYRICWDPDDDTWKDY